MFFDLAWPEWAKILQDHYDAQVFLASKLEWYEVLTVPDRYNQPEIHEDGSVTITLK